MNTSFFFGIAFTAVILGGSVASATPITIYGTGITNLQVDPHM